MENLISNGSLVAVYGSLRSGLGNHRVIRQDTVRQADGIIEGMFSMYSLGAFPALALSAAPTDIVVEVYEVADKAQAQSLDWLEGYPSFYDRKVVTLADGRECWVYFIHNLEQHQGLVSCGDWKSFKEKGQ